MTPTVLEEHPMEVYNLDAKLVGDFWFSIADMPFPGANMGAAVVQIAKRYPASGYNRLSSDMTILVVHGRCYLEKAGEDTIYLAEGDIVCIRKEEEYYWVPLGVQPLKLLAINSPPFNPAERKA
jgi:hypothetical protein